MTDTGIGIPPETQARLFEKFVQADASTTRRFGGTSLGLAISKRLVARMGGEMGLRSSPGQGSTFWFRLPLPVDASAAVAVPALDVVRTARVLVVDDLAVNRRHGRLHLQADQARRAAAGAGTLGERPRRRRYPGPRRLRFGWPRRPGVR